MEKSEEPVKLSWGGDSRQVIEGGRALPRRLRRLCEPELAEDPETEEA